MALTASQRITLIKEIADRLSDEGWSLIDLTLSQFGFRTSSSWNGTSHAYVLDHVGPGEDERLVELAQHLGYTFEQPGVSTVADPPFWKPGRLRVFLSHLSAHRAFTAELQAALLEHGISSFVAHNDIEPTLEWQTEIETALRTCHALVALLHPNFHASNWTDQEIGYVMGRGIPVFSVRLGQDPYGFIGRFQGFNGNSKTAAQLAAELFNTYRSHKQTREQLARGVVATFEASDSFAQAKRNAGLLEAMEYWEPDFSVRVEKAAKTNGQIQSSWGVPERVAALVAKWAGA
jgi:nucleoside 2-deoxyribosyltransferase